MMLNKPYIGIPIEELQKDASPIAEFSGLSAGARRAIIKQIQREIDQNEWAIRRSPSAVIHSGTDGELQMQFEAQSIFNALKNALENDSNIKGENIRVSEEQIRQVCDAVLPNIITDAPSEPRVETILLQNNEKSTSLKIGNIKFNIRGLLSLVADWVLIDEVPKENFPVIIALAFKSLSAIYDSVKLELDIVHSVILEELYYIPKVNGGVIESDLIDNVINNAEVKKKNLSRDEVNGKITELATFGCINIMGNMTGKEATISLAESIIIM